MEKYSRWRDAGTGIQPFLPPVPPRTDSSFLNVLSNIVRTISGSAQGLVKIPFILSLGLIYLLLVPVFGTLLTPVKSLKRAWQALFSKILLRLVLFFMGFFYIKTETVFARKSRNTNEQGSVESGDIIISNWTSYVDIIYHAYKFNPVFTRVNSDTNRVQVISLWQAIKSVYQIPTQSTDTAITVKELSLAAKKHGLGPIVIFPEGTTSNGRALLKFVPLFDDIDLKEIKFHLLSFKYEYSSMPPTFTIGNPWFHFFKLCSQFHNSLTVKIGKDEQSNSEGSVSQSLITSLGHLSKLRKTNLGVNDKRDFLVYYESRNKKKTA